MRNNRLAASIIMLEIHLLEQKFSFPEIGNASYVTVETCMCFVSFIFILAFSSNIHVYAHVHIAHTT